MCTVNIEISLGICAVWSILVFRLKNRCIARPSKTERAHRRFWARPSKTLSVNIKDSERNHRRLWVRTSKTLISMRIHSGWSESTKGENTNLFIKPDTSSFCSIYGQLFLPIDSIMVLVVSLGPAITCKQSKHFNYVLLGQIKNTCVWGNPTIPKLTVQWNLYFLRFCEKI